MFKYCPDNRLILRVIAIVVFILIFGFFSKKKVEAIVCAEGYYCTGSTQSFGSHKWVREGSYETGSCKYIDSYTCNGQDNNCERDWIYVYSSYDNCLNKVGASSPKGCCLEDSCKPTCSSSCPTGTTSTDTGDIHSTVGGGGDGCGGTCSTKNCYCEICTPSQTCAELGYSSSSQGYGTVPNSLSPSCRNGTTSTTDRTTKCDLTYSTCYCYKCNPPACDPGTSPSGDGKANNEICTNDCGVNSTRFCNYDCYDAKCADLQDEVEWLDGSCPVGSDCREYTGSVPILTSPSGLPPADISCPTSQVVTCHTFNKKPTITLVANSEPASPVLSFTSPTYTGNVLNNPNTKLIGEYTDPEGYDDIRKIYVWWKVPSGTPLLSKVIDNSLDAQALNDSFGIHITRNGSGNWQNVYVPNISGSTLKWTLAGAIGEDIYIGGPNIKDMIKLSNLTVSTDGTDTIRLESDFLFLFQGSPLPDIVSTGKYNLWGMADDYVVEMVDDTVWIDSGNDRSLDMVDPSTPAVAIGTPVDSEYKTVTVDVSASDDDKLSYMRLDACKSGITSGLALGSNRLTGDYPLITCPTDGGYPVTDITSGNSLLGEDGGKGASLLGQQQINNLSTDIYLNGNAEGSITFYLTVMDMAGNNNASNQDTQIYRLEQWAVVEDGLVFGRDGVSSSTRTISDGSWGSHPILQYFPELESDLTNQALLGNPSTISMLRKLERTSVNNSFKAIGYPGVLINSPYAELVEQYEIKKELLVNSVEVSSIGSSISDMSSLCDAYDYCALRREGNLTIEAGFQCDRKGLILVNGDITIVPDFTNASESDACIIVSSGDIVIETTSTGAGSPVPYDQVEAFMIANGVVSIPTDGSKADDGLFVEGGLVGFTTEDQSSGVYNTREVEFGYMGSYPVLVVQGNSKYGLLSRELFGSQIDIYQSEVGLKPY